MNFELRGVIDDGEDCTSFPWVSGEEKQCMFWSIYRRFKNGEIYCIADYDTEEEGKRALEILQRIDN